MHQILIHGPQGCGKGTQAALLSRRLGIPQFSMGYLLRQIVKQDPGQEIAKIIAGGNLVADEIAMKVLGDRLSQSDTDTGFILDGFPREIGQFLAFDKTIQPTLVIYIKISQEESIARLLKRSVLEGREDDNLVTIKHRLKIFYKETVPVIEMYRSRGLVREIDGSGPIPEVEAQIAALFR